ncbi:MAG: protein phosphatase 2C domain-containing protein [Myxococcales bacterium]|nr:protein phosphatase 2C domain-containing protein [Myxococcales bacterium]
MTKKDNSNSPATAFDKSSFFSDIAQDLQTQVEGLQDSSPDTPDETSSSAPQVESQGENQPNPTQEKEATMASQDPEGELFDSSQSNPQESSLYREPPVANGQHKESTPMPSTPAVLQAAPVEPPDPNATIIDMAAVDLEALKQAQNNQNIEEDAPVVLHSMDLDAEEPPLLLENPTAPPSSPSSKLPPPPPIAHDLSAMEQQAVPQDIVLSHEDLGVEASPSDEDDDSGKTLLMGAIDEETAAKILAAQDKHAASLSDPEEETIDTYSSDHHEALTQDGLPAVENPELELSAGDEISIEIDLDADEPILPSPPPSMPRSVPPPPPPSTPRIPTPPAVAQGPDLPVPPPSAPRIEPPPPPPNSSGRVVVQKKANVSVLRQNPITCPQCGTLSRDPIWCDNCGAALQKPDQTPFAPSKPGTQISVEGKAYVLQRDVSRSNDRVIWEASQQGAENAAPYIVEELSPPRFRSGYQQLPDLSSTCIHQPFAVNEQEDRVFLFSSPLPGYRLSRAFEEQRQFQFHELRHIINHVSQAIQTIHQHGSLFLQLDARQIWLKDERDPRILGLERLYNEKTPLHLRPRREGYSAPEIYQAQPALGPHTDVFAIGALLHYMISLARPFNHLDTQKIEIPSPRVHNLVFPMGLDHVILRALHPKIARRYKDVESFLREFNRAIDELEERAKQPSVRLQLAVGHDIHIGVSKGNRNPVNQDALFWRYDRNRGKGLFLVADGVSHCNYGSGDRASSLVIQAARKRWDALIKQPIMNETTTPEQRRQVIQSIFEAANQAIGAEINQRYDRIDGYVEDVMGSTCVACFLDGSNMTLANLGDSRGYLKTEHYIEQITVDHDYKTAQMQIRQDMRALQKLSGGSLITRCVGSFRKDEKMKLIPRELEPDFFELRLRTGDIIVICSDGLSDYAGANEEESRYAVAKLLQAYPDPLSACFWLIALANQNGGGDNISVIEIKVLGPAQS